MKKLNVTVAVLVFAMSLIQVRAQDVASMTGVVADSTGALIAGVHVELSNQSTGVTYKATTNVVGSYTIPAAQPGPGYTATFSHPGFRTVVVSGIYLNVNATRTENAKLPVGNVVESVSVSASNELITLDTTDASVGNNFEVQFLNDLPIANRDSPAALFYQQPGVTLDGSVTGARIDQTNVTLDGLDMNDNATGWFGAIVGNAPVDSVQEFRGVTASPLSSAGQGGGGQFDLVTKGGSNEFHGALVEYHRNTALEANDWFNNNNSPATPRPPLIRNQFGGNIGGPIWRQKAFFFFFDYDGRRDTLTNLVDRTVPLDSYRDGNVSYCNGQSTSSQCVQSTLNSSQVQALDPANIGFNSALLTLIGTRYPHANDFTGAVGDLVNTAGFRFNAPFPYAEDDYVQRVDFTLIDKMKFYGVGRFTRTTGTQDPIQFPGDSPTSLFKDQSYAWVGGMNWTISTNKVNQVACGETFENYKFDKTYNPQGINQFGFSGLSGPYEWGNNTQERTYEVPVVRDDFTWQKGRHGIAFGGTFKWETLTSFAAENFNFPSVGVTGNTLLTALTPAQRPKDISGNFATIYDSLFSTALGVIPVVGSNFNYNNKAVVQPQGSGLTVIYRYYETELYFGDTWKVTPQFTISYGVRYQNYTVPYETRGEQAGSNLTFDEYWADRVKQSQAGQQGNNVLPFWQYTLGGKSNHAPGYYKAANKNFAPRVAFAYNPAFDRKTVIRGGAGIIYDHSIVSTLAFQQLQTSYLFQASNTNLFGSSDITASLQTDPRFGGITTPPPAPAAPDVTPPYTPFIQNGVPIGLPTGQFNIVIDPNLKTPYNMQLSIGFQHEFPQGYILKADYVGRFARRLLAQADASQLIDFPDNTGGSNQTMAQAMGGMVTQLRANASLGSLNDILALSPQPWFEDVLTPGFGVANGLNNNTQGVAYFGFPYPQRGDFSDTMFLMSAFGLLPPNVGMASQFSTNTIWTNKGFSSYDGLLLTLHKNPGYGLQFDINYTWSHSIDNVSLNANSPAIGLGFGFICDITRPRECRGNSDFDVANYLNGNFIWELPVGRSKLLAPKSSFWLNEVIGGWEVSGLPSWHTGNAYNVMSFAFVAGFANEAPATLLGPISLLKAKVNGGKGSALFAFKDPAAALNAYTGPTGLDIGSRNNLRGPGWFNLSLGLGKTFAIWVDRVNAKFRADAFNSTNHPSFNTPVDDITQSSGIPFGTIQGTASSPRVLQVSLRIEF
jgi:hypothetical protein